MTRSMKFTEVAEMDLYFKLLMKTWALCKRSLEDKQEVRLAK